MEEHPPEEGQPSDPSHFERFEAVMRGLVSVTKEELDEALAKEKAEKARSPKKRKLAKG
jgi:hypothetical protein